MKPGILTSLVLGSITSVLYYGREIVELSPTIYIGISALVVQGLHDAVCIAFLLLYMYCVVRLRDYERLILLNGFYTIIMCLFSFYKRCILTLMYNDLLSLPECTRYVPIWRRIYNSVHPFVCDEEKTTYLWLNDHVFQSGLMVVLNVRWLILSMKNRTT